ncbi:MAG TPA: EVE domain-containing protein [Alphaproteobacteria bacterium]|nr:EVE domain-containing protein [Alphaproteobacteria bacterium]HAJ47609.1 EVE domain-containing protein [Alphaproteobacteria bacterium]
MAFWLIKSEPDTWSWAQQVKRGGQGEPWSGVRNHQAKLNLMRMAVGDECFFYHSNEGLAVMGIASVVRAAYPDPSAESGPWVAVDVVAKEALPQPVTMAAIKAEPRLAEMVLVKNSRLSVQPVTPGEWALVCQMGGLARGL